MTQKRYNEIPKRQKCINKEEPYIGGAVDIIDDTLGKPQSEVNQDRIEDIAVETQRATQTEGILDGKIATEKQRAEVVESGLNNRLGTVEQLAEISIGGGDAQIATGADFTNPDATKRAKVPAVGAVLDGLNDGIYDVSKRNPSGGPDSDGKFTLEYILSNADTLIPTSWRHGGMTISFVQSSDNKYVQYRYMSSSTAVADFTNVANWQGEDISFNSNAIVLEDWAANTDYVIGNQVKYNNINYSCKADHTSSSSFESNKWREIPEWINDGDYIQTLNIGEKNHNLFQTNIQLDIIVQSSSELERMPVGLLIYHHGNRLLYRKTAPGTYKPIPYYKGAIYNYNNELYVWDGSQLINKTQNDAAPTENSKKGVESGGVYAAIQNVINPSQESELALNASALMIKGKKYDVKDKDLNEKYGVLTSIFEVTPGTSHSSTADVINVNIAEGDKFWTAVINPSILSDQTAIAFVAFDAENNSHSISKGENTAAHDYKKIGLYTGGANISTAGLLGFSVEKEYSRQLARTIPLVDNNSRRWLYFSQGNHPQFTYNESNYKMTIVMPTYEAYLFSATDNALRIAFTGQTFTLDGWKILIYNTKTEEFNIIAANTTPTSDDDIILFAQSYGVVGGLLAPYYYDQAYKNAPIPEPDIPTYFETNLANAKSAVLGHSVFGKDGEQFVFITDLHWYQNKKHSPYLVTDIIKNTPCSKVIMGGDYIADFETAQLAAASFNACIQSYVNNGYPCFPIFGNHDANSIQVQPEGVIKYLTDAEIYNIMENKVPHYVSTNDNLCYCWDNPQTMTRFIMLKSAAPRIDGIAEDSIPQSSLDYLDARLADTPANYKILVFVHAMGHDTYGDPMPPFSFTYSTGGIAVKDAVDAHNAGSATSKVIAIFAGHIHYDYDDETTGGVPIIFTDTDSTRTIRTTATVGTITEQCFDVVTINYESKKIYLDRIGRGSSREITWQ